MTLHPQVAAFLEELNSIDAKPIQECSPKEFRESMRAARADEQPQEHVEQVENREIPGPVGPISIRIYKPAQLKSQGAVVYYHGGGWVGGDLDTHDTLCRSLTNAIGCTLVAVDYRLAPEHRYPTAADDAYAAFQWAQENLGINPNQIAVCGDSAGGNLAAVVCLMARDRGDRPPCAQVLIYPITNHDFNTPSYQKYAEGHLLSAVGMKWFWQHYVPEESNRVEAYASPLCAENLADLPPALVVVAECDVLCDEGQQYAARIQAAGNEVECITYPGMIHGFVSRVGLFDVAQEAIGKIAATLQKSFGM